MGNSAEVIGLVPAAGRATRLAPLPLSKEIFPIGFQRTGKDGGLRPKAACHYLLQKMRLAGVTKAYIVLREGKWDIPAYLGDGKMLHMNLGYLMMDRPLGVPYTLDQAFPFVRGATIAFGFPDILFHSRDAFIQLLERQVETAADVILGIFPTDHSEQWDMVDVDQSGCVRAIVTRPLHTDLRYSWAIAVWTPVFTQLMHTYLHMVQTAMSESDKIAHVAEFRELSVGEVIQMAIDQHLKVVAVPFPHDTCLDIGTPENLVKAVRDASLADLDTLEDGLF